MSMAIGLAIGAVAGIAGYLVLNKLAADVKDEATARLLRGVAIGDLVLMPTLGALIGAFVLDR